MNEHDLERLAARMVSGPHDGGLYIRALEAAAVTRHGLELLQEEATTDLLDEAAQQLRVALASGSVGDLARKAAEEPPRPVGRLSPRKENQMPRSTRTSVVMSAVLILALATGSASAGPLPNIPSVKSISSYWSLLVCTLFGSEKCSLTSDQSRTDVGCGLDPYGRACAPPTTTSSDTGLGLDPHGGDGSE